MAVKTMKFEPEYSSELVKMWRQSFQRAMGLSECNGYKEFSSQLGYFKTIPSEKITMVLDTANSKVVGFIVVDRSLIEQLYVHVDYQRAGIGGQLLQIAFDQSPKELELFTFQSNTIAQNFYQNNGFVAVAYGVADAASNPWASNEAQLRDIKYRWPA